jgi:hypothetical protein
MSAVLQLYEQLSEAPDDKTRARLISEAFDALEARFPQIGDLVTRGDQRESELRLQKEIRELEVRLHKEIREVEARLQKEIREVEARLEERLKTLEVKMIELDGARRTEMKQIEVNLQRAITAQTRWFIAGMAMLGIVFKLADLLIP